MAVDVLVRTYAGNSQAEAAARYGEDALRLAADGWAPVTQVWVADDWPMSAHIASLILVVFVIGIVLLLLFSFIKPVRTLMVTYQRSADR